MTETAPTTETTSRPQRRGLGTTALVLSLIPPAIALISIPIVLIASIGDTTGWGALGWTAFGVVAFSVTGLILGPISIVLGGIAAARRLGRGRGVAAIVIGSISLLGALPALIAGVLG